MIFTNKSITKNSWEMLANTINNWNSKNKLQIKIRHAKE